MSKEVLPGYLQRDANCDANEIFNMRNQFLRNQRARRLPLRFEIISPYTNTTLSQANNALPQFTEEQLNMRRKAEILQYKKSSSQSSSLTKKQKFSKLVSGPFQRKTKTLYVFNIVYTLNNLIEEIIDSGGSATYFNFILSSRNESSLALITNGINNIYSSILSVSLNSFNTTITNNNININITETVTFISREEIQQIITDVSGQVYDVIQTNSGAYNGDLTFYHFTLSAGLTFNSSIFNVGPCKTDLFIPTLSSSSDVPGPIVELKFDPNVPLYNYAQGQSNAISQEEEDNEPWTFSTSNNIAISGFNVEQTLFSLTIGPNDNDFNTFSFKTPIGFYIKGNAGSSDPQLNEVFTISSIDVIVCFGSTVISDLTPTIITDNIVTSIDFNVTSTSGEPFEMVYYLGELSVNDLRISTQFGFIYDIKLKFNVFSSLNGTYENLLIGNYLNLENKTHLITGISINSTTPSNVFQNMSSEFYLNSLV